MPNYTPGEDQITFATEDLTLVHSDLITHGSRDAARWDAKYGANKVFSMLIALRSRVLGTVDGHFDGLVLRNDTDADHDIEIGIGSCADSANALIMRRTAVLTKQIDAAWAAGDDAGGFPTGLTLSNSTWYHVFLIQKTADGTIDAGFDTSTSAANLLADATGYSAYQCVGSVLTDGSANIVAFNQVGRHVFWKDPPLDVNVADLGTTAVLYALSVPPDYPVYAKCNFLFFRASAGALVYVSSPNANDEAPVGSAAGPLASTIVQLATVQTLNDIHVLTNTSKQIRARADAASSTFAVATLGWDYLRGRT